MNIIFVKVGDKYNHIHVNTLYKDLVKLYPNSQFWCYTEDPTNLNSQIKTIQPICTLKKWWNKLALFSDKMPFKGKCLFFDLDVHVKEKIDDYFENFDQLTVLNSYWKEKKFFRPHSYDVTINSSIITWTAGQQNHVWQHFRSNYDYFMRKYAGIDRFLVHEKIKLSTFKDGIVNSMKINDRKSPVDIYNGIYDVFTRKFI